MRSLSVELKLIFAIVAISLAASLVAARSAGGIFRKSVEEEALASLQTAADAFLANEDLRSAFVARDRQRLLAAASPLFGTMRERDRITHWYFIEPGPT